MVYEPTTNFKDSNGVDLGKKLVTQDYVATVYPNLNSSFSGLIAYPAELYAWGRGVFGALGDNTSTTVANRSTPRQEATSSANWKQVTCGAFFTMAIKNDGTLWSWGDNGFGQQGDNTPASRSTPRQISVGASGITGWRQISAGVGSALAIRDDGTLWSWGRNNYGQVGDNTSASRSTPRQISIAATGGLRGWKQVASSNAIGYVAAIRYDGTLWLWGYGFYGNLGDNTSGNNILRSTPRQEASSSTNWKQVSCGDNCTVAIKNDGTLWVWGRNDLGQLGDNTNQSRSTPRQISVGASGITGWKQVSSGSGHSLALKTDGTLWTWGYNNHGQLGSNDLVSRSTPIREFTLSNNWRQVSCGALFSSAIKTDGTLWTWGRNNYGQIGDNTLATRSTPRQELTSSTAWRQIYMGIEHMAAIEFPLNRGY
jgi:alpha-tubulin suppressor-like RCC1 family protein